MIPYGRQSIEEEDIEAVAEVLRGDFLTTGPAVEAFEEALCEATQAEYSVACANGTAALHLAAIAMDVKAGDAVIVPSMTFLATANAARYCGADVVFADVNPETGLMEAPHLEEALLRCGDLKPKAVFPVHLAGQPVNLKALKTCADSHELKMVADASHAIGGTYRDQPVGACTYEDLSTFSFHPVKTIAMGEGGAITTNNPYYAERMKRARHHGMIRTPEKGRWAYEMPELGYNYRVTDFQCALGLSQMKRLERLVARRKEIVALYDWLLKETIEGIAPLSRVPDVDPAWHLYPVLIDFRKARHSKEDLISLLHERGVGVQVHYIPVHTQPYYKNLYGALDLPGAMAYYEATLSLPLYPAMTDSNVKFVVGVLKELLGA